MLCKYSNTAWLQRVRKKLKRLTDNTGRGLGSPGLQQVRKKLKRLTNNTGRGLGSPRKQKQFEHLQLYVDGIVSAEIAH